jgi:hypothetical protein
MKVYEFNLQLARNVISQLTELELINILHSIDKNTPIPQALEGGNGNGPLYLCVLDIEKMEELRKYCKENSHLILYTTYPSMFDLDETKYHSDYHVEWEFAKNPSVVKK